jgi:D-mannonate dehydratase
VVCLNTLGQDREFTAEEIKLAQRTVRDYATQWELIERKNLEADVKLRLASIHADQEYKQLREAADN